MQLRTWAAALLALCAPVAQQRPALLAAVPVSHHDASAPTPAVVQDAAADCHEHQASHGKAPSAPLPECCELALIPAVVTPWLSPRVCTAVIVRIAEAVVAAAPRVPVALHSQTRLPFATAPPDGRA